MGQDPSIGGRAECVVLVLTETTCETAARPDVTD